MTEKSNYAQNDPLSLIITYLEKANKDKLASDVLDVFAENATDLEQINLLAKLYFDVRNIAKAKEFALKVLSMTTLPNESYNARANLAKMYNNINLPEKSLFYSKLNEAVVSNNPDTKLEMVFSYYLLNKKSEAEKILRKLKDHENELSERHRDIVNFNLGTYDLEQGKFIEGLTGFMIKGKKLKLWFSHRELPYQFWSGGIFPGRILILFAEGGGIGDEFLSVRFMDDLKALGFKPIFYTSRKDLYNIFNRCGYETIMTLDNIPNDSLWTYFMQVPIYLESTVESIKRSKYLYPSDDARNKWNYIKNIPGLKIGVRWQGNAKNKRDLHRQVPLDGIMQTLHNVLDNQSQPVTYYSLQVGDGEDQISKYPELIDLTSNIHSYDDTLAVLENLDYVITSCTSVLHASAIVGTPTLALIPISAYFTWVSPSPNNTSIWYEDNLRLFRQVTPKKWDEPFAELGNYLTNLIK